MERSSLYKIKQKSKSKTKYSWNKIKLEENFLTDIKSCMFEKLGNFRLIEEEYFGSEIRFYVADNDKDSKFEELLEKQEQLIEMLKQEPKVDITVIKAKKKDIENHLKKMANQIVQVRLKKSQNIPLSVSESYFDLHKISPFSYSYNEGVNMDNVECIL